MCSRRHHRSRERTAATPGSGRSTQGRPGCGTWTSSSGGPSALGQSSRRSRTRSRSIFRRRSSGPPSAPLMSPEGGCCSSAARSRRCSSRSPCSPHAACAGTSRMPADVSPGTALDGGSSCSLTGIESVVLAFTGVLVGWLLGSAVGAVAAAACRRAAVRRSPAQRRCRATGWPGFRRRAGLRGAHRADHLGTSARGVSDRGHRSLGGRRVAGRRCCSARWCGRPGPTGKRAGSRARPAAGPRPCRFRRGRSGDTSLPTRGADGRATETGARCRRASPP